MQMSMSGLSNAVALVRAVLSCGPH